MVVNESWPDLHASYDYPKPNGSNEARWRDAIAAALANGTLSLSPSAGSSDIHNLEGLCPRCGHEMDQRVEFDVIIGALPIEVKFGTFNVQCNCSLPHDKRDDKRTGCGWGGSIPVPLSTR